MTYDIHFPASELITDDHTIAETNIPLQHRIVDSTTAAVAKLQELFPVDLPPLWPPIKLAFTKAFIYTKSVMGWVQFSAGVQSTVYVCFLFAWNNVLLPM